MHLVEESRNATSSEHSASNIQLELYGKTDPENERLDFSSAVASPTTGIVDPYNRDS